MLKAESARDASCKRYSFILFSAAFAEGPGGFCGPSFLLLLFCGVMGFCQMFSIWKKVGSGINETKVFSQTGYHTLRTCVRSSVSTVMTPGAWCTRYVKGNRVTTLASRDGACAFLGELFSRSKPSVSPGFRAEGVGEIPPLQRCEIKDSIVHFSSQKSPGKVVW